MAASPEPLEDLRLTTERNAKSPGARGLGRRTEIRAAAIVGEQSLLHERRKQNKTPQTLSSHGTLVEQPFPKELLIFSLTACAVDRNGSDGPFLGIAQDEIGALAKSSKRRVNWWSYLMGQSE